jgi:hypothetical protein
MLAPHTEDAELAYSGTLARLVEGQYDVFVALFSIASDSLPVELPRDTLKHGFCVPCKYSAFQMQM